MYSYIKDNDENYMTAKVIRNKRYQKKIKHHDYKNTLFNSQQMYHKMKSIRSDYHQLGSYKLNKVSLS